MALPVEAREREERAEVSPLIRLIADILILASLAGFYLAVSDYLSRLKTKEEELRREIRKLEEQCRRLKAEVSELCSPSALEEVAAEAGLVRATPETTDFLFVPVRASKPHPRKTSKTKDFKGFVLQLVRGVAAEAKGLCGKRKKKEG